MLRAPTTERSGTCVQTAGSFRAYAKQAPADGFLHECERLPGFTRFRLGGLRTELHRRQLVFSGSDTRLSVLQSSRRVLQFAIGLMYDFTSLAFGGFNSLSSKV